MPQPRHWATGRRFAFAYSDGTRYPAHGFFTRHVTDMRLLIYVEPHPVRNGFLQHNWIAHQFAQSLAGIGPTGPAAGQVRLLVNRHVGEELASRYSDSWRHVICPSAALSRKIDEALVDWSSAGMATWTGLLTGEGPICALYEELLEDVKRDIFDFDSILVWGNNGAVRRFAARHGVQVIHMELGPTRSPFRQTAMFDPDGTNHNAALSQTHIGDIRPAFDTPPLSTDVWRLILGGKARPASREMIRLAASTGAAGRPHRSGRRDGETILLPLQLSDDANILVHAPFASPLAMLQALLPKLRERGAKVLIKPHPAASHRHVNVTAQDIALRFAQAFANVTILSADMSIDDAPTLFRQVDGVVTMNSSMGFEALLYNKKLCVLGEVPYKIQGVFPDIDAFLNNDFDRDLYEDNVKYLVDYLMCAAFMPLDTGFSFAAIRDQVDLFKAMAALPAASQAERAKMRLTWQVTGDKGRLRRYGLTTEAAVPSPPPVKRDDKTELGVGPDGMLLLPDGSPLPLLPDAHNYFIDTWKTASPPLIQGWVFDRRTLLMPKRLIATTPNRVAWSGVCTVERPGAQNGFLLNTRYVGFGFTPTTQAGSNDGMGSLRLFAVNERFQATELLPPR